MIIRFAIIFILSYTACAQPSIPPASSQTLSFTASVDSLPKQVGDISFDPSVDDPAFTACDSQRVFQYYNTASYYKDHKKEIARYFTSHYKAVPGAADQTGYLTTRFIINCAGATGRFRLYQLDSSYRPFRFSEAIAGQLLTLARQLKGWEPARYKDKVFDSYQYITFTLKKGRIVCITP